MSEISNTNLLLAQNTVHLIEINIKLLQESIKDKSEPLEDRWNIYLLIQPYLKTDGVYWSPESIEKNREISWFDDFYLEKDETMQLDAEFIERVEDKIKEDGWEVDIDELKEEILAYGYGSFENDW